MDQAYRMSEEQAIQDLLASVQLTPAQIERIRANAAQLVEKVRAHKPRSMSLENFLKTYALNTEEGLALMCLAEALLRIPDAKTQTKLIRDKIGSADWAEKMGRSDSFVVNLASMGLAASDHLLHFGLEKKSILSNVGSLTRKMSEPIIRQSVRQAMKILGYQFVLGETVDEALLRADELEKDGYRFSYDMLGEAALTAVDAERYFVAYVKSIQALAQAKGSHIHERPSISIKLSALHPRYELSQRSRVLKELVTRVFELAKLAKASNVGLTIDAEESERLVLSLEVFAEIYHRPELNGWSGFGLAVQAYSKRAPYVLDWLVEQHEKSKRQIPVRLVKGAYWDSEIKRTQEKGLSDYPLFTRKICTDVSYLACAEKMFRTPEAIYPQFATHNAYTVAAIQEISDGKPFEFQRLQGMGEQLYEAVLKNRQVHCRIYAPVGIYRDLLSYLIRRLLENGASSSFVNQLIDPQISIDQLTQNPMEQAKTIKPLSHPSIPNPRDLLRPQRMNSKGIDLSDYETLGQIEGYMTAFQLSGKPDSLTENDVRMSFDRAYAAYLSWSKKPVSERSAVLHRLADLLEEHMVELMAILSDEGGKTLPDGIAEVREAVDFCRYYGNQAEKLMGSATILPGPTGEINELSLHGRGVFVCISPWNFPLAIFLGQIVAALATGNCVLAKPAAQTTRIAQRAVELAYEAGIPQDVLQLVNIKGSQVDEWILKDPRVAGVAFTGSNEVARQINLTLAQKEGPIVPLIAETGGINAMLVDSSALFEQVVRDVITSAFQSAGQRCSALRLLFVQEDIADGLLRMLAGAMAELKFGDPKNVSTDVGPVIDASAQKMLNDYGMVLSEKASLVYCCQIPDDLQSKNFVSPQVWELKDVGDLNQEIFGPILHVVRFNSESLRHSLDQINAKGYGLTMGLHSRIDEVIQEVRQHACVGNLYVNRNMIGAVVGVQPFGGEGLSGTGPKAGGPHYLTRFVLERTFTQDTTAAGGNATLLAMTV